MDEVKRSAPQKNSVPGIDCAQPRPHSQCIADAYRRKGLCSLGNLPEHFSEQAGGRDVDGPRLNLQPLPSAERKRWRDKQRFAELHRLQFRSCERTAARKSYRSCLQRLSTSGKSTTVIGFAVAGVWLPAVSSRTRSLT